MCSERRLEKTRESANVQISKTKIKKTRKEKTEGQNKKSKKTKAKKTEKVKKRNERCRQKKETVCNKYKLSRNEQKRKIRRNKTVNKTVHNAGREAEVPVDDILTFVRRYMENGILSAGQYIWRFLPVSRCPLPRFAAGCPAAMDSSTVCADI